MNEINQMKQLSLKLSEDIINNLPTEELKEAAKAVSNIVVPNKPFNEHPKDVQEQILKSQPKPLLSICVISSPDDRVKRGPAFVKSLPKSDVIELIFVETIPVKKKRKNEYKRDLRLTDAKYYYEGVFDFAAARNYAKGLASGHWILSLDMDELLPSHNHNMLLTILNDYANDYTVNGFNLGILSSGFDHIANQFVRLIGYATRIFRNIPDIYWQGKLHEVVNWSIEDKNTIIDLPFTIEHYGYEISHEETLQKMKRNIHGLCNELKDTKDEEQFHHYLRYLKDSISVYEKLKNKE